MLQYWTMYITVDAEVLVTIQHQINIIVLNTKEIIRKISAMTLIYKLASVLLIRAQISLQFSLWPLGVSLSLHMFGTLTKWSSSAPELPSTHNIYTII